VRRSDWWLVLAVVILVGSFASSEQVQRRIAGWTSSVPRGDASMSERPETGNAFSGAPYVIDGDTLELSGRRVRLWDIDAPESAQSCLDSSGSSWSCGRDATAALRDLARGRVDCEQRETDRYGRGDPACWHTLIAEFSGAALDYV